MTVCESRLAKEDDERRQKSKKATFAGSLFSTLLKNSAPHTGQSSQLFLDVNDGNAQFLSKVARGPLSPTSASSLEANRTDADSLENEKL